MSLEKGVEAFVFGCVAVVIFIGAAIGITYLVPTSTITGKVSNI